MILSCLYLYLSTQVETGWRQCRGPVMSGVAVPGIFPSSSAYSITWKLSVVGSGPILMPGKSRSSRYLIQSRKIRKKQSEISCSFYSLSWWSLSRCGAYSVSVVVVDQYLYRWWNAGAGGGIIMKLLSPLQKCISIASSNLYVTGDILSGHSLARLPFSTIRGQRNRSLQFRKIMGWENT